MLTDSEKVLVVESMEGYAEGCGWYWFSNGKYMSPAVLRGNPHFIEYG